MIRTINNSYCCNIFYFFNIDKYVFFIKKY